MAAHPIVVVNHGRVEIPEELQGDPRFKNGARLQLVPIPNKPVKEDHLTAWEDFRSLRGIFANSDYDPNAELELEKQRELEEEAGWARK